MDAMDKVHEWKQRSHRANVAGDTSIGNGGWGRVSMHSLAKKVSWRVIACSLGPPFSGSKFSVLLDKSAAYLTEQRGFTLIENLVAVSILAALGVNFLMALDSNARATRICDEQVTALNLASTYFEAINEAPYASTYHSVGDNIAIPPQYGVVINTRCSSNGTSWSDCTGDETLQKITISISCGGKPILSICNYRSKR